MDARFVLYLAQPSTGRLQEMLHSALAGTTYRLIRTPAQLAECRGARILFAVQLGEAGLSPGLYDLLFWLRQSFLQAPLLRINGLFLNQAVAAGKIQNYCLLHYP